jgi:hypothetical protein
MKTMRAILVAAFMKEIRGLCSKGNAPLYARGVSDLVGGGRFTSLSAFFDQSP